MAQRGNEGATLYSDRTFCYENVERKTFHN